MDATSAMSADNKTRSNSPFWQFSIKFYAVPGVAPACIRLQDEAGVDVNVLFFLLWNASQGRSLSEAEVQQADHAVAPWRSITVIPLREIRRTLKTAQSIVDRDAAESFRNRIKQAELEAERLEQEALFTLVKTGRFGRAGAVPLDAARASIAAYEALLRPLPREPLDTILAAFAKHCSSG
ncbi:MAG TPA: TIGR02444 family protein [Xanthobacteraceae bacterium]|nr:TIGR02444 family protein [Xanthobacteraceae bacterium]